MISNKQNRHAVWAITPNGVDIAKTIADKLSNVDIFISDKLPAKGIQIRTFGALADSLSKQFHRYERHVFIMATGIVVRMIAPLIQLSSSTTAAIMSSVFYPVIWEVQTRWL